MIYLFTLIFWKLPMRLSVCQNQKFFWNCWRPFTLASCILYFSSILASEESYTHVFCSFRYCINSNRDENSPETWCWHEPDVSNKETSCRIISPPEMLTRDLIFFLKIECVHKIQAISVSFCIIIVTIFFSFLLAEDNLRESLSDEWMGYSCDHEWA